ncbi:hypothetical protein L593_10380 [Salinarchaeum sp. Harcht-Bsk1]|uniref:DUF7835 family putative zinc beta-ribbon protein n=1 Tax=Salinarchaeum sp. Harcht-Bsk1 TaxID=1333523 RepID=UPI00034237FD|nr:hypothetical protein [Salinarchaeum sp. Harcht-Bsk1]AGN02021.1 hypothetical protein L593_10380 [Salinarchaeum sp. Harcht-Bsk1]
MATTDNSLNGMTEPCDACGTDTLHEVSVQIMTEAEDSDNAHYSREPYRVRECQRCGERTSQRMNNA